MCVLSIKVPIRKKSLETYRMQLVFNFKINFKINSLIGFINPIRALIFIYCGLFVLILVVFVLFLLSLRFGQISPLAFFRWFTATSDRNAESFGPVAQRMEALSVYGSWWALSEDSGFKSYPSRPEVYLVWRENFTFIPKRDFIFAHVKTGQVGTWSLVE